MNNCDWCSPEPCRMQVIKEVLTRGLALQQTPERRRIIAEVLNEMSDPPTVPAGEEMTRILEVLESLHKSRSSVARILYKGRWYMIAKMAECGFYGR